MLNLFPLSYVLNAVLSEIEKEPGFFNVKSREKTRQVRETWSQ